MRIIVTGADGALGCAVVRRYEQAGCRIAAFGRSPNRDRNSSIRWFTGNDLSNEDTAQSVITQAVEWLGALDALIHVAGGFQWIEAEAATLANWRSMFDVNLATAVASVTAALPAFSAGGSIVLVGANSAQPAGAGMGPYAAAKSGVARFAEALSNELRTRKIRVNAVLPGIIDTPRNRSDMPDTDPKEWTQPEAVADVIAFLTSDDSRAINGALLPVDNAA